MISLLTFSNCEDFLSIADTYSLTSVIDHYNNLVLTNFEEFIASEQFLKEGEEQLCNFLVSDEMCIKSEMRLFECVSKWVSHDPSRKDSLQKVLECIRFGLMSEEQLTHIQHQLLTGGWIEHVFHGVFSVFQCERMVFLQYVKIWKICKYFYI